MATFGDLPPEVRAQIWEFCLPDPETPEIYFFEPDDFKHSSNPDGESDRGSDAGSDTEWEAEREVLIGVPVIMHLCHESRAHAQARLTFKDVGHGLEVPCRPYRPATDVFAVRGYDFDDFFAAAMDGVNAEFYAREKGVSEDHLPSVLCREIAHLAIDGGLFELDGGGGLESLVHEMSGLRHLSIVLHRTGRKAAAAKKRKEVDPSRRCKLVPFTDAKGLMIPGRRTTEVEVEDFIGGLMDESAFWEVASQSPNDKETGEWLFETKAMEMVCAPGIV